VAVAAPHLEFSDRSPPQIAVGGSSARALQAYSRTPVWFPDDGNDSEAALALPIWHTLPQGSTIAIIRGQGGREFTIYKFRSMAKNSEAHGAQLAQIGDARVTRVGKFIRKTGAS